MGGKCLKQLLGKWNTGDPYRFKIYYHEVDKLNLKNETLRIEKRKLGESLIQETAKRLRVEEKLSGALAKAEKKGSYYKKKFKRPAKKVAKEQMKKKGRGPANNKKFNDTRESNKKESEGN